MNIPFAGSFTKEEFKDIIVLGQRPVSKKFVAFIDVWIILLFIGAGVVVMGLRMLFTTENLPGCFVVVMLGIVILIFSVKFQKAVDQGWDQYKKTDLRREGDITDTYLGIRNSTGNSQLYWTGFSGYGEYRDVLVLFQGLVGYPFSARFFQTEADWQEFKKFASSKFPITHRVPDGFINSSNWFIWLLLTLSVIALFYFNR